MSASDSNDSKLAEALIECKRLRKENRELRERLGLSAMEDENLPAGIAIPNLKNAEITAKSDPERKVQLFRSLFRGRDDIYAVRWEARSGKSGYSPAHRRLWDASF